MLAILLGLSVPIIHRISCDFLFFPMTVEDQVSFLPSKANSMKGAQDHISYRCFTTSVRQWEAHSQPGMGDVLWLLREHGHGESGFQGNFQAQALPKPHCILFSQKEKDSVHILHTDHSFLDKLQMADNLINVRLIIRLDGQIPSLDPQLHCFVALRLWASN